MTKCLTIDPKKMRAPGKITFKDIPMNTYQKTVKDEVKNFTKEEFMHIYRDMWVVREFETMLNSIKTTGQYEGIEYNHPGPGLYGRPPPLRGQRGQLPGGPPACHAGHLPVHRSGQSLRL